MVFFSTFKRTCLCVCIFFFLEARNLWVCTNCIFEVRWKGNFPPAGVSITGWGRGWVQRLRPPDILNTHVAVCDDLLICYYCVHMLQTLSRGLTATCVMCYKLFTECWAKTSVVTYTFWFLNANFLTVQHSHPHFVRFLMIACFPPFMYNFCSR